MVAKHVSGNHVDFSVLFARDSKQITYLLHGILADASQFASVAHSLPGTVVGVTDYGTRHDHSLFTQEVRNVMMDDVDKGYTVNAVGASMGGMQILSIVAPMPDDYRSQLGKLVPVDAPPSAAYMKELPKAAISLMASPLGYLPLWFINHFALKPPKDHEIELPARLKGEVSEEEFREQVKAEAMANLSGHPTSIYHDWIGDMIRLGRSGQTEEDAKSLLGLDVIYVACMSSGNETILQPAAATWWQKNAGAKVVEVDAVHCGFLQQEDKFTAAFREIFVS